MKTAVCLVFLACIISVPAFIIGASVNAFAGWEDLYNWGFEKYEIAGRSGIDSQQLEKAGQAMAGYLAGKLETPQVAVEIRGKARLLYNEKELIHLVDVRGIVVFFRILLIVFAIVLIVACAMLSKLRGTGILLRGIMLGSTITLVGTALLVIWALVDFESLFFLFHVVSFNNDLWLLDPSRDYLIVLFPQGFFNDAAIGLVGTIILTAGVVLALTIAMHKLSVASAGNKGKQQQNLD